MQQSHLLTANPRAPICLCLQVVVGSKMLLLVNNTFGCQLKFPEHLLMQLISWGLVLSSNPEL